MNETGEAVLAKWLQWRDVHAGTMYHSHVHKENRTSATLDRFQSMLVDEALHGRRRDVVSILCGVLMIRHTLIDHRLRDQTILVRSRNRENRRVHCCNIVKKYTDHNATWFQNAIDPIISAPVLVPLHDRSIRLFDIDPGLMDEHLLSEKLLSRA